MLCTPKIVEYKVVSTKNPAECLDFLERNLNRHTTTIHNELDTSSNQDYYNKPYTKPLKTIYSITYNSPMIDHTRPLKLLIEDLFGGSEKFIVINNSGEIIDVLTKNEFNERYELTGE